MYSLDFERFWAVYPKKVGKRAARKAWNQTKRERPTLDVLVAKVEALATTTDWMKESGQYVPQPATWLRRGGWDDEIRESPTAARTGPDRAGTKAMNAAATDWG